MPNEWLEGQKYARQRERAEQQQLDAAVSRRSRPHLRCGICEGPIESGQETVYVDDERCHRECAEEGG